MSKISQNIISELQKQYAYDKKREELFSGYRNAIETLSEDLYNQDFHFLYEIIQNADDNIYSHVSPYLELKLCQLEIENEKITALCILNNEDGFTDQNVKAICNIGKSTKKKSFDSIGEKGIGFKSVFRITDCPYIYSNRFAFKLPEHNPNEKNGLGYIVPYQLANSKNPFDYNTSIILPLNKDKDALDVAKELIELSDYTILFLRKLKTLKIEIDLPDKKESKLIERRDTELFRYIDVTFDNHSISTKFFLDSVEVQKPDDVSHKKRKGVEKRVVNIAIPLSGSINQGVLFSYLPVWKNTGLPFMVNSDFLLTSDRENLHVDYDWNIWLRDEIAKVFCNGIEKVLIEAELTIEEKQLVYKSIPLNTRFDFLNPVLKHIINGLRDKAILPAFKSGSYFSSSDIRFSYNNLLELILSSKKYPKTIEEDSFPLLSPDVINEETKKVFEIIGVKKLNLNELKKYFLSDETWIESNPPKWFVSFFEYLKAQKFTKGTLKEYNIVPIENSRRLHSGKETNLYLELNDNEVFDSLTDPIKSLLKIAEVEQELIKSFLSKDSEQNKLWLKDQLGIYPFIPKNLGIDLVNLIKNQSDTLSTDEIIQLTERVYVLDKSLLSDEKIILIDSENQIYKCGDEEKDIVVSHTYNQKSGWQQLFVENDRDHFKVISEKYSKRVTKELVEGDSSLKAYPSFKRNKLNYASSPKTKSGKALLEFIKRNSANDHYWKLEGYEILRPLSLAKENLNKQVSSALLSFLKSFNFQSDYWGEISVEQLLDAGLYIEGTYSYRGTNYKREESTVFEFIKNKRWMFTEKHGFQVPSSVFLDKKQISEILGDSVPYIKGISNKLLINLLGIKTELTRQSLIDYLIDAQRGKVDLKVITKIYSQLDQRTNDDNGFTSSDLVKKLVCTGKSNQWATPLECIWEDPKEIGDGYEQVILSLIYPDSLKSFFVDKLKVSESLSVEFYLSKWKGMQSGKVDFDEAALETIYKRIKKNVLKKDNIAVNDFLENILIYSPNEKMFYDPSEIYFPDNVKLRKLFEDDVPMAYYPKGGGYASWLDFYKILNVPILSEHIQTKVSELSDINELSENKYLTTDAIKLIAAYIMTKKPDGYLELLEDGTFQKLVRTREYWSDNDIPITIQLDEYYEIETNNPVYFSLDEQKLCFNKTTDKFEVAIEIYNLFKKRISILADAKNAFELYLEESNLKRKSRDGLETPHEVYELLGKLKSEKDSRFEKDLVQKENDNISPQHEEQETDEAESGNNNIANDKEIPSQYPERDDSSISGTTEKNQPDNKGAGRSRANISSSTKENSQGTQQRSNQNKSNGSNNQPEPAYNEYEPNDLSNYKAPAYQKPESDKRRSQSNFNSEEPSTQADLDKETRKLDKERDKLADSRYHLGRKSKLLVELRNESKFTFKWLKILTELEYLNEIENSKSSAYNLTFNQVSFHDDVILLDFPNRYVSSRIEQYENLKLVLYTEERTITISVQSVSVNRYSVRAKLWKSSDIKNINQDAIEKAVLKIESVDFLWQTLLDQLHQVQKDNNITENASLRKLIKDNQISFIFGPPGTGKTTTILTDHIVPDLESDTNKTLVLTPTNKAADVITERLIEKGIEGKYFRFGNTGNDLVEQHECYIAKKMNDVESSYTLISTIARFPYDLISYDSEYSSIALRNEVWDKIILDEASMINLPQIIGLILSVPKATEIVIVGDPFQIKPILNLPEWNEANIYDLVGLYSFKQNQTSHIKFPIKRLMKQYRSLHHIGNLYGEYSYDGLLEGNRGNLGKPKFKLFNNFSLKCLSLLTFPINQDTTLYGSKYLTKSSYHLYLAIFLVEWLLKFVQQFSDEKKSIGIISPYRAQSDLLYKLINANHDKLNGCRVLVSTVHGFQGDECDIIICALNPPKSKSDRVVLNNKNVLNVAISRARDYLILFMPENYETYGELKEIADLVVDRSHNKLEVKDMETAIFGSNSHIEEKTFATAHHPINVFGSSSYKYEIRIEDDALDIQINNPE